MKSLNTGETIGAPTRDSSLFGWGRNGQGPRKLSTFRAEGVSPARPLLPTGPCASSSAATPPFWLTRRLEPSGRRTQRVPKCSQVSARRHDRQAPHAFRL
jgi:hypothetical protein